MRRPWPGRRRPAGLPGAARSLLSTGAGARRYGRWRYTPTAGGTALGRPRPGTVPQPTRSADCDLLGKHAFGPQLVDGMVGVDDAHRAGSRAQDHRLRVRVDVLVAHSLQQLTGRDSCGREEDVGARAKVVEAEHLVRLVAFFTGQLLLLVVPEMELRLHVAADRLDRARREHAFGGAARPHHAVDPRPGLERSFDRGSDVAGRDQLDAGPHVANLGDHIPVPITLEPHHSQLLHRPAPGLHDAPPVPFARRLPAADPTRAATPHPLPPTAP